MRGAALLSGLARLRGRRHRRHDDATSASSQHGFPREASLAVEIGGVRTNFRMPDVLSIGIGGGSVVTTEPDVVVGPMSVGYELTTRARSCSAATTLTATDVAVAAGLAEIGDRELVRDMPHTGSRRGRDADRAADRARPWTG